MNAPPSYRPHPPLPRPPRRDNRATAPERGYDARWQRCRNWFISRHPVCKCGQPATEVDHIVPVREAPELRLVEDNLQSMCHGCHMRKHARERRG